MKTILSVATQVCVSEWIGSGKPHGLSLVCCVVASFSVVGLAPRAFRYLLSAEQVLEPVGGVDLKVGLRRQVLEGGLVVVQREGNLVQVVERDDAGQRRAAPALRPRAARRGTRVGTKKLMTPALMSLLLDDPPPSCCA